MTQSLNTPFNLSGVTLGLTRDGKFGLLPKVSGPPALIDGLMIGVAAMSQNPPHGGEMHPDGDELIYVVSGRATLHIDDDGLDTVHELQAGHAFVIPKGTWHRFDLKEPTQLLHVTPGPRGEHRPLNYNK